MGRVWLGTPDSGDVHAERVDPPDDPVERDDPTAAAIARLTRPLHRQPAQQHNQNDVKRASTTDRP